MARTYKSTDDYLYQLRRAAQERQKSEDVLEGSETAQHIIGKEGLRTMREAREEAAKHYMTSGYASAASAFSQAVGGMIDYQMLKTQNRFQENQAKTIEIQAQEVANQLREQFNQNVGVARFSAAQRGVKSTTGSTAQNIDRSAKNLQADIKQLKSNAAGRASTIRAQSSINRKIGRGQFVGSLLGAASSGFSGYQSFQTARRLRSKEGY